MEIGRVRNIPQWTEIEHVVENNASENLAPVEAAELESLAEPTRLAEYMQVLGSQIAELTKAFGGSHIQTAATSHKELVEPMRMLLTASNNGRPATAENIGELQAMLQAFIRLITGGATPDMNPLGTLAAQMLSQMPRGTAQATQQKPMTPPPGIKHEEFVNIQKHMNEGITKNDIGAMRSFASNPKYMACASPEQKAAMMQALAKDSKSHPNDVSYNMTIGTNDRSEDRRAMQKIASSCANGQEFRSVVEGAGADLVKEGIAQSPKDVELRQASNDKKASFPDKTAADFDTLAGAFGCPDLAANSEQALAGQRAAEKGYSPQEVAGAREKISYYDSRKINPVSEDPLLASVVSNDEKAAMIYTMRHHDFRNDDKADRTIANLAMTSSSKQEYDDLMSKAGQDVMSIAEKEAKGKVEKLAAGYGRTDLVTDPAAFKYENVLIDPATRQKYLGGAAETERARQVEQGKTPEDFKRTNQEYISAELERMDPVSRNETVFINVERESQGKPPLNPVALRKEAQQTAESKPKHPQLGFDMTEQNIKEACKREGLSDYTARNLVTQPCARAYERGGAEAAGYLASQIGPLEEKLQRVIATQGPFSPEAKALREQIDGMKQKMQPYINHVNGVAGKFNNMYPPPTSAFDELGKFFTSLVENVFPALLNVIPYVGPALYAGYQGVRAIVNLAQGNFLGALGGIASALPGVGVAIGGVMKGVLGTVGNVLGKGAQAVGSVMRGDIGGMLGSIGGGFEALKGVGGTIGNAMGVLSKGAEVISKGASVMQGVATGDASKIASGISGVVDQMNNLAKSEPDVQKLFKEIEKVAPQNSALHQVTDVFGRAGQIGTAFMTGNFEKIQNVLKDTKLLGGLPIGQDAMKFLQTGAGFAERLQKGKVHEAFGILMNSKDPLLHGAGTLFQDGNKFLESLKGDLERTLGNDGKSIAHFVGNDAIKDVSNRLLDVYKLGKLASETGFSPALLKAVQGGVPLLSDPAVAKAIEFANSGAKLVQDLANGNFSKSFGLLGNAAGKLFSSQEWHNVSSLFNAGGNLMQSIKSGQLESILGKITSADPLIQNALNEVVNFSQVGRAFLSALDNPGLVPQFTNLISGAQQSRPELTEVLRSVAGGSSVFSDLASGYFTNVVNAYESELKNLAQLEGSGSPFAEFEQSAQQLLNKGNLENQLLKNLAALQQQQSFTNSAVEMRAIVSSRF